MTRSKIGLNNLLKTNKQYERELEIGKIAYQKRTLEEKEAEEAILLFKQDYKKNADREIQD